MVVIWFVILAVICCWLRWCDVSITSQPFVARRPTTLSLLRRSFFPRISKRLWSGSFRTLPIARCAPETGAFPVPPTPRRTPSPPKPW